MRGARRYSGEMLMATGALHTAVGVGLFRRQLAAIGRERLWDAVEARPDRGGEYQARETAYWFLLTGAGLCMTGQLARWARRETGMLPAALGWSLLGASASGAVLMPRSGFWLVIPQALLIISAPRRKGRTG